MPAQPPELVAVDAYPAVQVHGVHAAVVPVPTVLNAPAGHGEHAAVVPVPNSEYEPAGHGEHAAVVPVPNSEYEPAGHAVGCAPPPVQYWPAAHAAQEAPVPAQPPELVAVDAYPAVQVHGVHAAVVPVPTVLNAPAGHGEHAAVVPVPNSEYEPAGQETGWFAPPRQLGRGGKRQSVRSGV